MRHTFVQQASSVMIFMPRRGKHAKAAARARIPVWAKHAASSSQRDSQISLISSRLKRCMSSQPATQDAASRPPALYSAMSCSLPKLPPCWLATCTSP
eukprot:scaffold37740_cov59-Phaeocystis_antarctica.AAC.2